MMASYSLTHLTGKPAQANRIAVVQGFEAHRADAVAEPFAKRHGRRGAEGPDRLDQEALQRRSHPEHQLGALEGGRVGRLQGIVVGRGGAGHDQPRHRDVLHDCCNQCVQRLDAGNHGRRLGGAGGGGERGKAQHQGGCQSQ